MLGSCEAGQMTHSALEERLRRDGADLIRQLLQDHLDLRAARELRLDGVEDSEGALHSHHRTERTTPLETVFGDIEVRRRGYEGRGLRLLSPADAALNLPKMT